MTEAEVQSLLVSLMVHLIVRYPDGIERIEMAKKVCMEVGLEMSCQDETEAFELQEL